MAIEIICRGCAQKLQVAEEHAGKTARCPACGGLNPISEGAAAAAATASPSDNVATPELWRMQTDRGEVFGPISRTELEAWVAQGRVAGTYRLSQEGSGHWRPAVELYPQLAAGWGDATGNPWSGPAPASGANPFAAPPTGGAAAANPYAATAFASPAGYLQPHRGTLILVLGILSWAICAVCGLVAFILGLVDLRAMREGRMDPTGMALTRAGMYLGLAHMILTAGIVLFVMFMTITQR